MLDVRRLRLLRDLARLGTVAAVAEANAYTPSAVSQQLTALQRQAGVRLLERVGRRVVLTSAGVALVEHAETVLAALEAADAALAAARGGLCETVRIGAFPSAVPTLLPAALVALGREHPALELMVTELDPVAMPGALRDRRLDVGLVHDYDIVVGESPGRDAEPDSTLDSTPLLDETIFLAVPASVGDDVAPDPIGRTRHTDWIMGTPGTLCHTVALRTCRAAGFTPRVRHHADDFTAVLALVAAGQGVAMVPQLATGGCPAGVRLIALPIQRRTRVAYRRGAGDHPAVTACVAALRASAAGYLAGGHLAGGHLAGGYLAGAGGADRAP